VFLRGNREPPPIVVQCAIAEAQLIGRNDLAFNLSRTFGPRPRRMSEGPVPSIEQTPAGAAGDDITMESPPVMPAPAPAEIVEAPSARATITNIASPIAGVPDDAWSQFCGQLVREAPTFQSQRHVGRYRHRKDRLAQVGFDPDAIIGSPDAQDAALCADLADAHRHLVASGMADEHLGRAVSIPDVEGTVKVSLSGVLGIASVAGLEGAAGWLERKQDRKKFPHTTMAFLRTNGVF
jgi:hypothetical protein